MRSYLHSITTTKSIGTYPYFTIKHFLTSFVSKVWHFCCNAQKLRLQMIRDLNDIFVLDQLDRFVSPIKRYNK